MYLFDTVCEHYAAGGGGGGGFNRYEVLMDICLAKNGLCLSKNRFDGQLYWRQPGNYFKPCNK